MAVSVDTINDKSEEGTAKATLERTKYAQRATTPHESGIKKN